MPNDGILLSKQMKMEFVGLLATKPRSGQIVARPAGPCANNVTPGRMTRAAGDSGALPSVAGLVGINVGESAVAVFISPWRVKYYLTTLTIAHARHELRPFMLL